MNKFMELAINEARQGIYSGHGGPFGAVIVKDGKLIGVGHNRVVVNNDPTCHGEIDAIRDACKNIANFDLSGCEIYTTGEPCPMCLCALLWANVEKIYYACTIEDNENIGFRDVKFYTKLNLKIEQKHNFLINIDREEGLKLFSDYKNIKSKVNY